MMELLFARAGQGRMFLWLFIGGMTCGVMAHAGDLLRRRHFWLAIASDALTALCAAGMLLCALALTGSGLRGYALAGLCLGFAAYQAGLKQVLSAIGRRISRTPPLVCEKSDSAGRKRLLRR